jgi:hypothetical protein
MFEHAKPLQPERRRITTILRSRSLQNVRIDRLKALVPVFDEDLIRFHLPQPDQESP